MEEQNEIKKNRRGGRREGAGRKAIGEAKRATLSFRVSDKAVQNLKEYAERMGKTRNDVINELLEGLI